MVSAHTEDCLVQRTSYLVSEFVMTFILQVKHDIFTMTLTWKMVSSQKQQAFHKTINDDCILQVTMLFVMVVLVMVVVQFNSIQKLYLKMVTP